MEAYSYKTNEWFFVAPMNTRRSSVGVDVVEGKELQWVVPVPVLAPGLFLLSLLWVRDSYPDLADAES